MRLAPTLLASLLISAACGSDHHGTTGGACGEDPDPPGATACPSECTGGCQDGLCTILCDEFAECDVETITCPAGHACLLVCSAGDACDASTVECPSGQRCEVQCDGGVDACGDLLVHCNDASTCTMTCSDVAMVCTGAALVCGGGACKATCAGGSAPTVECGDSCACAPC